jgi:hypothetical protein
VPPRGRSARLTGVDAVGVSPLQDVWSVSKSPLGHRKRSVIAQVLGILEPSWDYALVVRYDLLRATVKATDEWQPAVAEGPPTDASLGFPHMTPRFARAPHRM